MRKVSESVEEMLLDYLDGNLTKADKEKVEKNLQEIPAWRARYEELRSVNSVLAEAIIGAAVQKFHRFRHEQAESISGSSWFFPMELSSFIGRRFGCRWYYHRFISRRAL